MCLLRLFACRARIPVIMEAKITAIRRARIPVILEAKITAIHLECLLPLPLRLRHLLGRELAAECR